MGAVLGGEIRGAVLLWIASIVLALVGIAPVAGARNWIWLPWQIDGVWALVGAIGWGYLVCAAVAGLVGGGIERRGYGRPAAGWLRIAIAISGYGAMAVGHTAGARIVVAVLAGAVAIRLVAFNLDGSLREWRWTSPRHVSVSSLVLSTGFGGLQIIPQNLRHQPGAHMFRGYVWHPTRLPYRLGAGHDLWINATVRLASCGSATINTLRMRYSILGIGTAETIPLQEPLSLNCRR